MNENDEVLVDLKMTMACNPELIFYTSVLYGLELEFGKSPYNTAHVMGTTITFDEGFLMGAHPDERLGLLLHEVRHITDLHEFRIAGRKPQPWNTACDHAINLDITASGFKLPSLEFACCDKKYKNMSAEEIYEDIIQNEPEAQPMMQDLQGAGGEPEKGDGGGMPQIAPQEGAEDDIKDLLIQAVQIAQRSDEEAAVGNIPAHILRMVEAWLNPVVPWQEILQRYMNQKAKDDYSWQRPSRRYMSQKLYIPSLYSEQMGPIHCFIDGSCSVSDNMFDMQVGQVKWIKHNLNPKEIRIVVFNTRIVDEFIFSEHEPIDVNFSGRGGTRIHEVVGYMEKNKCECNIIMTDGYFTQVSLNEVKDDVLCLIYDNEKFEWKGATTIYLPKEK